MSVNPFETSLTTLHEAAELAGVEPNVVKLLEQPKRIFEFTIPLKMDDGRLEIFTAYRVHYCDALGQTKDGTRFVPNLDIDTVKALGFWMTIKHAVAGIPAGGGKGGIRVDPSKLSENELERLTRAYIRKLPMKGVWVDIPGADIGTSAKTQAWMLDELEELQGFHSPAAINDKPAEANGTVLSREATGMGAYFVTKEAVSEFGVPIGARVAIQGFGNVGRVAARLLYDDGYKIVAVGDIYGGIQNMEGINLSELEDYVDQNGKVTGFPGTNAISTADVLEVECDILMPAAVQSVITEQNAYRIKAKLIMECANGPIIPEAEKLLEKRGVAIIPDVLTNCGGAIVCSFERTQGLTDTYWDEETVSLKLKERIVKAYKETSETAGRSEVSFRDAAWMNALMKIQKAMKVRGWV